jgi:hypothetical protein
MKYPMKLVLFAAVALLALPALSMSVIAKDHDHDRGDRDNDRGRYSRDDDRGERGHVSGAPGPIAGAGLPILAVGYGVYWLLRRRRQSQ